MEDVTEDTRFKPFIAGLMRDERLPVPPMICVPDICVIPTKVAMMLPDVIVVAYKFIRLPKPPARLPDVNVDVYRVVTLANPQLRLDVDRVDAYALIMLP